MSSKRTQSKFNESNLRLVYDWCIFDGSWQKRGFSSMNGVVTVSSLDSGKISDVHCISKYCFICKGSNICNHEGFQAKYIGTSRGIEICEVEALYDRSNTVANPAQYVNYLGDGDSQSFEVIKQKKPYGEVEIRKLEYGGHVQKRMGTRLRGLRQKMKGVLLEEGIPLSGKNRQT